MANTLARKGTMVRFIVSSIFASFAVIGLYQHTFIGISAHSASPLTAPITAPESPTPVPSISEVPTPTVTVTPTQIPTATPTNTPTLQTSLKVNLIVEPERNTNFKFIPSTNLSKRAFYMDDSGQVDDGDAYTNTKRFTVAPNTVYSLGMDIPTVGTWHITRVSCGEGVTITQQPDSNNPFKQTISFMVTPESEGTCEFVIDMNSNMTGVIFNDVNRNKVPNKNEPRIQGREVLFYESSTGAHIATAVTNEKGGFNSRRVIYKSGYYVACERIPADWVSTTHSFYDERYGMPCYEIYMNAEGDSAIGMQFGSVQMPPTPTATPTPTNTPTPTPTSAVAQCTLNASGNRPVLSIYDGSTRYLTARSAAISNLPAAVKMTDNRPFPPEISQQLTWSNYLNLELRATITTFSNPGRIGPFGSNCQLQGTSKWIVDSATNSFVNSNSLMTPTPTRTPTPTMVPNVQVRFSQYIEEAAPLESDPSKYRVVIGFDIFNESNVPVNVEINNLMTGYGWYSTILNPKVISTFVTEQLTKNHEFIEFNGCLIYQDDPYGRCHAVNGADNVLGDRNSQTPHAAGWIEIIVDRYTQDVAAQNLMSVSVWNRAVNKSQYQQSIIPIQIPKK